MIKLTGAWAAWGTSAFNDILKQEICQIDPKLLPLQQGMSLGSYAMGDNISTTILSISEDAEFIRVKTGIFFTSVIAGCNCADDPTPMDEQNEYCEVLFSIDKTSGDAQVSLI